MNESFSKYVDQLVLQKLISQLSKVHHFPNKLEALQKFQGFDSVPPLPQPIIKEIEKNRKTISFPSFLKTEYPENDYCWLEAFLSPNSVGTILFIHGLYEDNLDLYKSIISVLHQQNFNFYLYKLPFHYERKPKESKFSGEFLWSGDFYRSAIGFLQSLYDLYQIYHYIKSLHSNEKVMLVSFSMGGAIGLLFSGFYPQVDGVAILNPACKLADIVFENPLCSSIKEDILQSNYTLSMIEQFYNSYDPFYFSSSTISRDKILMVFGIYDQIFNYKYYNMLAEEWKLKHILKYNAGHINLLKIPKLGIDIGNFFKTLA